MNKFDYQPTPEELDEEMASFHSAIENWEEEGDSLYPEFQSVKEIEKFNKLSVSEKFELTLHFIKKKQSEEIFDLEYENASDIDISKLEKKHKKQIDDIYTKKYNIIPTLEEDIKKIQAKKYLSPKEMAEVYKAMSISSQETYRGRLRDKIPYKQIKKKGNITYSVIEVEEWMENNNVSNEKNVKLS